MKKLTTTLLSTSLLLLSFFASAQTWSHKRSVEAYAEVNASAPSITIKWETEPKTDSFVLYRRSLGSDDWGSPIANLSASATEYTDNSVSVNTVYEYRVLRIGTDIEPFSQTNAPLESYGFLAAGIELDPVHFRGEMLLLVTRLIADSLESEVEQLMYDLTGDGWNVSMLIVEDSDSVASVKTMITDKYNSEEGLHSIFLLGHVPVPYSGAYCDDSEWNVPPDGHGSTDPNSHCGAWPADVYYGIFSGEWKDEKTATRGKRAENQNNPADGKFDNIILPDSAQVPVGRVDMSSLTKFPESEVELTRRYLQKAHAYKSMQMVPIRKGIIEDNFSGMSEGFASGAWRDFSAIMGTGNTIQADLFTTTAGGQYLFNYVCGAGGYQSCNGLGKTDSFINNSPAVFNHMFGSFFGDFDIANNIGRASIAAPDNGLIWIWSGRPKWVTHSLSIGETMGDCAIRTQNCDWDYGISFFQNQVHVGLLGDPSLRAAVVAPATNITSSLNPEKTRVMLDWTASVSSNVTGYYVYWSNSEFGPYYLLNQTPIAGTSFTHYTPEFGDNYYMIRAEKLETSGSASYYNLSTGSFLLVEGVERTTGFESSEISEFSVYPVPANQELNFRFNDASEHQISILSIHGQVIHENMVASKSYTLDVSGLQPGVYLAIVDGQTKKFVISRD